MKKVTRIVLTVFIMLTSACVNVSTIPLGTYRPRLQTDPGMVEVYLLEKDVPGEFKKIALIFAEEVVGYKSAGDMIRMMRIKAAQAGANGIILNDINNVQDFSDMESGPTNKKQIKAVAIYVRK